MRTPFRCSILRTAFHRMRWPWDSCVCKGTPARTPPAPRVGKFFAWEKITVPDTPNSEFRIAGDSRIYPDLFCS